VLRGALYVDLLGPLVREKPELLKAEVIWNTEYGFKLTADEISSANRARGRLVQSMAAFFETHDILACPVVVVPPVDAGLKTVSEVEGHPFQTYFDWIFLTFAISLTGCPAISIPCGMTKSGLPIGLQLVGRPHADGDLLSAAAALEDVFGLPRILPIDPRSINEK
jgi:amidase